MARVADTCFLSDISKGAVTVVVIEHAAVEISDVEILPAIVVVVACSHAETPAAMIYPCFCSHVGKCTVVVVAVELAAVTFS